MIEGNAPLQHEQTAMSSCDKCIVLKVIAEYALLSIATDLTNKPPWVDRQLPSHPFLKQASAAAAPSRNL